MKKKYWIMGTFLLIFIILATITYMKSVSLPVLEVIYKEQNIEVKRGSYCWSNGITGKCVDTIGPKKLLEEIMPTEVKSNKTMLLGLSHDPEEIYVEIFEKDNKVEVKDGILTIPEIKGKYIITVSARWEKGTAWYAFKINVV